MTESPVALTVGVEQLLRNLPDESVLRELQTADGQADPFPAYRRLLAERSRTEMGSVLLGRYADCAAALRHPDLSSDDRHSSGYRALHSVGSIDRRAQQRLERRTFLHHDPPRHTRLRRRTSAAEGRLDGVEKVLTGQRPDPFVDAALSLSPNSRRTLAASGALRLRWRADEYLWVGGHDRGVTLEIAAVVVEDDLLLVLRV